MNECASWGVDLPGKDLRAQLGYGHCIDSLGGTQFSGSHTTCTQDPFDTAWFHPSIAH